MAFLFHGIAYTTKSLGREWDRDTDRAHHEDEAGTETVNIGRQAESAGLCSLPDIKLFRGLNIPSLIRLIAQLSTLNPLH
jgi:hypothetical protein